MRENTGSANIQTEQDYYQKLNHYYEDLINNSEPIDAKDPLYEEIFRDLQGGIIRNYGRNYYVYIFVSFHEGKVEESKKWIRDNIAKSVTSTWMQLKDTEQYRQKTQNALQILQHLKERGLFEETYPGEFSEKIYSGRVCKNFFLSYGGYMSLGFNPPNIAQFSRGMKGWWEDFYETQGNQNESDSPKYWNIGGENHESHALILLAHDNLDELKAEAVLFINEFYCREIGEIAACEVGYALRNKDKQVIGPFGFVDGISQPLFLKSDYDSYRSQQGTAKCKWDPKASLSLVLRKDPNGEPYSFGSVCVLQKLETNYQCFEKKEQELAETLGCEPETAAALVVGRFRDGTPIALYPEKQNKDIEDNFNYDDDPLGKKCPVQAHIRKVNPRGDKDAPQDTPLIFRAGITYFDDPKPQQKPNSKNLLNLNVLELINKLEYVKKVRQRPIATSIESISGLLFVCFQNDIVNHFQKLQFDWADDKKFPRTGEFKYLDPIIGHLDTERGDSLSQEEWQQQWPKKWNGDENDVCPMPFLGRSCVKNKGGEFFFTPSISFLKKM